MAIQLHIPISQQDQSFQKAVQGLAGEFSRQKQIQVQKDVAFLKDMNINPVQVMGNKVQSEQMKKISHFNEVWTDVYKAANGKLTVEDQVRLQQDKNNLTGWQETQNSALQNWEKSYQIISDPKQRNNYNRAFFEQQTAEFKKTGTAPNGGFLRAAGKDLGALANDLSKGYRSLSSQEFTKSEKGKEVKTTVFGGQTFKTQEEAENVAKSMASDDVKSAILKDEGYQQGAMDYFSSLPDKVQERYLIQADIDSDGLNDEESQNAVVMAAQDYVINRGGIGIDIDRDPISLRKKGKDTSFNSSSGNSTFSIQTDLNSNYSGKLPGIKIIGKETMDIPSEVFIDDKGAAIETTGDVRFEPNRILADGKVEGTIMVPLKEVEEKVPGKLATIEDQMKGVPTYAPLKKGQRNPDVEYYTVKRKKGKKKITVQANYKDIEDEFDSSYPTLKKKMEDSNFKFGDYYKVKGKTYPINVLLKDARAEYPGKTDEELIEAIKRKYGSK